MGKGERIMTNDKRDTSMRHEQENQISAPQVGSDRGALLPPEAQGQIARQLRQVYGEMLAEPMPDKFAELLAKLSQSEGKS